MDKRERCFAVVPQGRPQHRERLPPHDGQQGVEVDVGESLGQKRDLCLGVNNVPASLHQLRLLEEPAIFGISGVMPLNIYSSWNKAKLRIKPIREYGINHKWIFL